MELITEKRHDSSMIKSTKYDRKAEKLYVTFSNGAVYCYKDFTKQDYDLFDSAESKGKHFLSHVRDKFKTEKL